MSAIAGICHWDQRPVKASILSSFAEYSRVVGPDGGGTVSPHPWLALQSSLLHFDSFSIGERQPLSFGRGSVVTWDGRLDNRPDLLMQLHQDIGEERSDAALVAAAYARWGLDSLRRLIGDWSLAIWDAQERRVVLARDYAGNRPLYVYQGRHVLAWATCYDALLYGLDLREPDEEYIAGRLMPIRMVEHTPYAGVRLLRSGHYLCATANETVSPKRYFVFEPNEIVYRSPHDYTDHLRELITDAVRVRLRSNRTVWSHLSGGFDSSSIVCLAHRLITDGLVEAPRLQPLTWEYAFAPEDDEARFVKSVERWCGVNTVWTKYVRYRAFNAMLEWGRRPLSWDRVNHEEEVQRAGDRIVLAGFVGDTVLQNTAGGRVVLLEHIRTGHPFRLIGILLRVARQRRLSPAIVGYDLLREFRWARYDDYVRALALRQSIKPGDPRYVPVGLTPDALTRVPQPALYAPLAVDFPLLKRRFVATVYRHLESFTYTEDRVLDVWVTAPYTHRPLVEFVLAVPPLALYSPFRYRDGMKRALADVLPPEVLCRNDKVLGEVAAARDSQRRDEEFDDAKKVFGPAQEWQLVMRGYAEKTVLATALELRQISKPMTAGYMRACVELEGWLRTLSSLDRATDRAVGEVSRHVHGGTLQTISGR